MWRKRRSSRSRPASRAGASAQAQFVAPESRASPKPESRSGLARRATLRDVLRLGKMSVVEKKARAPARFADALCYCESNAEFPVVLAEARSRAIASSCRLESSLRGEVPQQIAARAMAAATVCRRCRKTPQSARYRFRAGDTPRIHR